MDTRTYPRYNDPVVKWVGRTPAHWQILRLKHVANVQPSKVDKKSEDGESPVRFCNYVDVYYHDRITADMDFMRATATEEEKRKFQLRFGDVCVTKDSEEWSDIAVPACVADDVPDLLCGYHLALVRPRSGRTHGEFLARAFSARGVNDQFRVEANGITRFALGQDALCNALFLVPPLDEQQTIANFLDRETGRIDALVKKKERLIGLLQEQRTALISHTVTQGLNPSVPQKDSGVPWLKKIPAKWAVLLLRRFLTKLEQGWSPVAEGREAEAGEWAVLKLSAVSKGRFKPTEQKALPSAIEPDERYTVRVGELLVTRANTPQLVGDVCVVDKVPGQLMLSDLIYRLTICERKMRKDFLACYLLSRPCRFQVERDGCRASQSVVKISQEHIAAWLGVVPSLEEQAAIVESIKREFAKLDALMAKVRTAIDRLQEYRTALISAAVTGQIDVRHCGGA